jgi:hypothetical protein
MAPFCYGSARLSDPRGQIRLVHLLPDFSETPIKIHTSIEAVDQLPSLNALSYTWGSQVASQSVAVNELDFHVTTNLEAALRRLQLTDATIPVWVDSVCINQDDRVEKEHQVALMREIYSMAQKVCIRLGNAYQHPMISPSKSYPITERA